MRVAQLRAEHRVGSRYVLDGIGLDSGGMLQFVIFRSQKTSLYRCRWMIAGLAWQSAEGLGKAYRCENTRYNKSVLRE